jgi:tRNA G18 (ribose-2'-O)-methylase SpoU
MEDKRNLIDFYKFWTVDAIKGDLDAKRHNFSVVVANEINDFNLACVVRNSNAFLAKEVIIVGRKQWDRRGAVGTHIYENLKHVRSVDDLVIESGSVVIGVDNVDRAEPIETFSWSNKHIYLVFGQETVGIKEPLLSLCERMCYIRQYGSVRSLNVGVASGIAMYALCVNLKGGGT